MSTAWQAVLYVHLLAMAFFLGGQLVVGLALVPVERKNPDPERLRAVARRFGIGSAVALGVLLATGIAISGGAPAIPETTRSTSAGSAPAGNMPRTNGRAVPAKSERKGSSQRSISAAVAWSPSAR